MHHGWVRVLLDGAVVAERAEVQHNRSYQTRRSILAELGEEAIQAGAALTGAEQDLAAMTVGVAAGEDEAAKPAAETAGNGDDAEGASCLLANRPTRTASIEEVN